jgi:proteasome lid subunit RPN8/RPN11
MLRRVQVGIHQEVNDAFAAAPHLAAETGGILLGRREPDRVVVEDFEPVPCEHSLGPSYRLSDTDRGSLRETLDWFRARAETGLSVLGFYRSHTVGEFILSEEDEDLMRSHFLPAENLVVLVKPSLVGSNTEDFFVQHYRASQPAETAVGAALAWPEPRPRVIDDEPERPARSRRVWYIAAVVLGLAGGALGYVWLHPPSSAAPAPVAAASSLPAQPAGTPAALPPALPEAVVEGTPAPPPDLSGIHALLNRWTEALKQGDIRAAADCYAPVVTTYFARHEVPRDVVRQSLQLARARYGRLDVYRISGLGITPVSDSRAVATFRKHWHTTGRARSGGEEEERMTLVRNQGGWHISSEQTESR